MSALVQPLYEINHRAIKILCQEIGVVNTLRFIQQFSTGLGNYTLDREAFFKEKTLPDVLEEIKKRRK